MTTPEVRSTELLADPVESPSASVAVVRLSDRVVVAGLVLVALALRAPNLGRAYWVDEGISVGISSHPVSVIPKLLREDGSPPLFYVILHFWMRLFGSSPNATHALALLVSLAAVPAAYWAGRELFGRLAGRAAAALMATNPFLNWYATETRMYTLVVVLATLATTFVWRAVRDRRVADAASAVAVFAALLYTHDWAIYLTGVTTGLLVWLGWQRRDRQLVVWTVAGAAVVLAVWLPWVSSFAYQAGNTAAPWAIRPQLGDFFADPASTLGGTLGFFIAPLLFLGSYWCWTNLGAQQRWPAGALASVAFLTTVAGFAGALVEPSWTVRYLAVIVAPYLLAAAGILAESRRGRGVLWTGCISLCLWALVGLLLPNPNGRFAKDNMADVAAQVSPYLGPGDVVVVTQTEQIPVAYHYLPKGLTYLSPTGPVADPSLVDWRNIVRRLLTADPCTAIAPTLAALPVGATVLEVNPVRTLGANGSRWSRAVNGQVVTVDDFLSRDTALTQLGAYTPGLSPRPFSPVDGILFEKTAAQPACA